MNKDETNENYAEEQYAEWKKYQLKKAERAASAEEARLNSEAECIIEGAKDRRDKILNTILTDSQKLAMHFLELLPEGKREPSYIHAGYDDDHNIDGYIITTSLEWQSDPEYHSYDDPKLHFSGSELYFECTLINFTLDSTTIPQEILDLIPNKGE